jgi:hypothetical protein
MRNVMVALVSFVAGFLCSPLSPIHTSTLLHAQGATFARAAAVPVIPSLGMVELKGSFLNGSKVDLDGFALTDGTLNNVTLVYGGGAYKLENVAITGNINIQLFGAASNGASLLARFGLIGCPSQNPPPAPKPNTPMTMEAKMVNIHGTIASPFGQK